jgi:hypothetical protein
MTATDITLPGIREISREFAARIILREPRAVEQINSGGDKPMTAAAMSTNQATDAVTLLN